MSTITRYFLALILAVFISSGCAFYSGYYSGEILHQEESRCIVTSAFPLSAAVEVFGDRGKSMWPLSMTTVRMDESGWMRSGLLQLRVAYFDGETLTYGTIFKRRSKNFGVSSVSMSGFPYGKTYFHSSGCTKKQAAIGVVVHILGENSSAAHHP